MSLFDWVPLFSGDPGIYQTVSKIKDAIYHALREPNQLIRKRAEGLVRMLPERDERAEVTAVSRFVKGRFHFVHDPRGIEYTKSPEVIDREISTYHTFLGDCDDATGYLAALLKALGYNVRLAVISSPNNPQGNLTHIFPQVYLSKQKKWTTLDMTARHKPLGWTAPSARFETYDV